MGVLKVTLDDKLQSALKARAKRDGKSVNALVAESINAYIKRANGAKGKKGGENGDAFVALPPASINDWDSDEDPMYDSL